MDELPVTLARQLKRLGLSPDESPRSLEQWQAFLGRVGRAYDESRQDAYLLQRSLGLVSTEMLELNAQIKALAQSQVSAERDRLEAVISALSDGFASLDLAGRVLTMNPAAIRMLGRVSPGDEILSRFRFSALAEALSFDDESLGGPDLPYWLAAGLDLRDDSALLIDGPSGDVPVSVLVFPITHDGELTSVGLTFRDITERVEDERRRDLESWSAWMRAEAGTKLYSQSAFAERLEDVLNFLVDGLSQRLGGQWSAAARLLGGADLPGQQFAVGELAPGWFEDLERTAGMSLGDIRTTRRVPTTAAADSVGDGAALVVPLGTDGGRLGHLVLLASTASSSVGGLPADGSEDARIVGESLVAVSNMVSLAIAEDRARHAAEQARVAAEAAAAAKSAFLANMSHEIRTPMNGVLGMLDLLAISGLNESQSEYVAVAQSSAVSMLTVINDILDFSKIEAGKVALESIPFDVCEIVEDVAALCSPLAVAKGVELSCCFPVTIRSDVKGDPNRLRQVLANLIGNAAKFTPSGEVAVSVSQVDQDEHSVVLRFEVQDTGIGMSVASRARIFDSFGQADSSTTREFGGTGLGLTIARQLVTLMGGSIELSSDEGEGTTFAVRLRMELQSGPGDALALLPTVAGVRALTVDESRTSALAVSGYLRDWGLDVHVVTDSHRAIDVLRAAARNGEPFRVALLSRAISSNDVWSLASSIRADPLLSGTRLVLVTSDGSDHPTGGDSPFDFTLSKPVRRAMLRNIVSAMLEPHTVIAPSRPVSAPQPGKLEGLVLLVEDNVVNQRLAVGMLTRLGLEVAVANDGQEALDMLWEREYDLVLMDCQMPVLDGFEATRELRRREGSGRRTPIIALTAGAMAGNEDDCRAAGMDGYLTKPYRLRELHSAVESWLVPVDD